MCNRVTQLRAFLNNHRNAVREYQLRHLNNALTLSCIDRVDAIEWIFLNAISAAGGPVPLESKRTSMNELRQRLQPLREHGQINFDDFARAITNADEEDGASISQIRTVLCSGVGQNNSFPHVGIKKADLFLRDLLVYAGREIFGDDNLAPAVASLRPPIDVVHEIVYCIFHEADRADVTHDDIQEWAATLFPRKPVNADDVWFWGHFAIKRRTENKQKFARMIRDEANSAMVEADPHLVCVGVQERIRIARLAGRFSSLVLPPNQDDRELPL